MFSHHRDGSKPYSIKHMKLGFILTTYDRIDDLLAHLDILKFFPHDHEVIPVWMNEKVPEYFLEEMAKYPLAHYKNGISFRLGPLLGLVSGLRKAEEAGVDYIVYRNGDDWLFNHDFCLLNFMHLETTGKHIAAYNWLTHDSTTEFAMNEMYMRVKQFASTSSDAERYFLNSNSRFLCELKMTRWIKRSIDFNFDGLYRLPGRENEIGVGYEVDSLTEVIKTREKVPSEEFWKSLEDNSRFFNRAWQLIGSHNNYERYNYYYKIRSDIRYANELEKLPHFARWLHCTRHGKEWNLPTIHKIKNTEPALWDQERKVHLIMNRHTKKMPLRLITKTQA